MQSEQLRQRERKRLQREREKKESRKAQTCAGDELDFLMPRRVTALFGRAVRVAREEGRAIGFVPAGEGTRVDALVHLG